MSKLASFLQQQQNAFLGAVSLGPKSEDEIEKMKANFLTQIKVVSRQNRIFLWINVGMVLFVFLASILLVYHFIDQPKGLKALSVIFGASGVTIGGMIYYMTYLWRQIVGIELTIAMVDRLRPADLPKIIDSLLSTIKKK